MARRKGDPGTSARARQARFIREYVSHHNATRAAIQAGHPPAGAGTTGCLLLKDPKIAAAIAAEEARIAAKLEVTAERIMAEYARLAFSEIGDVAEFDGSTVRVLDSDEIPDDARRAIKTVSASEHGVKIEMHSKIDALEKLAKIKRLFDDRVPEGAVWAVVGFGQKAEPAETGPAPAVPEDDEP